MVDEPIRSVFHEIQEAQGGEFEDFDGWLWMATLGDPAGEYLAVRTDQGKNQVALAKDRLSLTTLGSVQQAYGNPILPTGLRW